MVADDIALDFTSSHCLQGLVDITSQDSSEQQYVFSEGKTKVQQYDVKQQNNRNVMLNNMYQKQNTFWHTKKLGLFL